MADRRGTPLGRGAGRGRREPAGIRASFQALAEAAVSEEVNDGGAFTSAYPYDADVILSTATHSGGLSMGRVVRDRCHSCDVQLVGGTHRPKLDGFDLEGYVFSDADPLVVPWAPLIPPPP